MRSIARRFGAKNPVEDSWQYAEGWLGLIRAAETFDPSRGFQFSTYAWRWIESKIRHQFRRVKAQKYGGGKIKELPFSILSKPDNGFQAEDLGISKELDALDAAAESEETDRLRETCREFMRILHPREQRMVEAHVMHGITLEDVAATECPPVTGERVRQIVLRAMRKMSAYAEQRPLLTSRH